MDIVLHDQILSFFPSKSWDNWGGRGGGVGKEVLKTTFKTKVNKASLGTVTMMVLFSLQKCSEKGNSKLVREHLRIYIFCSFPGCIIPNSLKAPLSVTNMYRII